MVGGRRYATDTVGAVLEPDAWQQVEVATCEHCVGNLVEAGNLVKDAFIALSHFVSAQSIYPVTGWKSAKNG